MRHGILAPLLQKEKQRNVQEKTTVKQEKKRKERFKVCNRALQLMSSDTII